MNKFLISGVGPGPTGVGRLMKAAVPAYKSEGYCIITRRFPESVSPYLKNRQYFKLLTEISVRLIDEFFFRIRPLFIFSSEVVFLHPQSSGFLLLIYLSLFNRVYLYVMDNSFFCIRSYNMHPVRLLNA
jgi:hypothetical protein